MHPEHTPSEAPSPEAESGFQAWIGSSVNVPPIPLVARKVIELVNDPYVSASIIKKAISADQALAARVIRMANSAFYSPREPVNDMRQAVMVLGFNTIKEIVVGASLKSLYKSMGLVQKMMWEHSVAVAVGTRIISRHQKVAAPESTMLAGLLHDIGKVVMLESAPERYQGVIESVYNERGSFLEAEGRLFGFNHTQAGLLLVENWNFSDELGKVVHLHHEEDFGGIEPPELGRLVAAVGLANLCARRLGLGSRQPDEAADLAGSAAAAALRACPEDLSGDGCEALLEEVRLSFEEESRVFM